MCVHELKEYSNLLFPKTTPKMAFNMETYS